MIDYEIKPRIIDDSGYFKGVDKKKYIDRKPAEKRTDKKSTKKPTKK